MRYMIIETFKPDSRERVEGRLAARGRLLPDGLEYLNSWLEVGGDRCFQLMETQRVELIDDWIERWRDLVEFEVVPVAESAFDSAGERR